MTNLQWQKGIFCVCYSIPSLAIIMTSMRGGQLRSTAVDKNVKLFWKFFHTPRVKKRSKSLVIAARGEFFLLATVRCCCARLDCVAPKAWILLLMKLTRNQKLSQQKSYKLDWRRPTLVSTAILLCSSTKVWIMKMCGLLSPKRSVGFLIISDALPFPDWCRREGLKK